MIRKHLLLLSVLCGVSLSAFSQASGDYRSFATGNWNAAGSWETFNGTSWVAAGAAPTSANNAITILNGHTITVTANVTTDQTVIQSGGVVTVNGGVTVTLGTASGDDINVNSGGILNVNGTIQLVSGIGGSGNRLRVNGTLNNNGSFLNTSSVKLIFEAGSNYFHLFDGTTANTIPAAFWNATSTINITGFNTGGATVPSGLAQTFGNLIWNCPNQDQFLDLAGAPSVINGNFQVDDTGAGGFYYNQGSGANENLSVGGDFIVNGGTLGYIGQTGDPGVLSITGDLTLAGGYFQIAEDVNAQVNVTGDLSISGSTTFEFSAISAVVDVNLQGNYSFTGGDIFVSGGTGNLNFTGASTKTFTSQLTPTGAVNYSVANVSTLSVPGANFIGGTGTFTLNGTLQVGSTHSGGALQTGTSNGNLRVSGTRTFASNSSIVYNGTSAQFIGNGFPSSGVVNLTINNSNNVTLSTSLDIVALSVLTLTSGNIVIGSQTLTINGTVSGSGGIVGGSSSNLVIGGTGNFGTLTFSGTTQLLNFTLNRTSSGLVTLGGNLTILGTFTHTAGTLAIGSNTLTISGAYGPANPDDLSVTNSSTVVINGSGTLPSDISFAGTDINTLTLNRASTTLGTTSSITIANLNLTSGTFSNGTGITIATGGTITRSGGSMTGNPTNTTNAYNVVYGAGTMTSGPELPSNTTALSNLSKTGSGTLTLNSAITVNGTFTLSSGTFTAGANAIDLKGNFVSSAGSTLTSSLVTFSGTTTISGSSTPTFGAITISGTLTPSINIQYNGTISIGSSGVLNAGSTTSTFGGTTTITVTPGGSLTLNAVTINASSSLTAPSSALSLASITNNGTFTGSSATVTVSGSITNNGTGSFTAPSATLSAASLTNSGTFTGSAATLTLSGSLTNSGTFSNFSNVSASSLTNSAGTFTAPSGSLTLTGDFTNSATFTHNSGTVVFNGTSSILGSTVPSFRHITISGTLNGPTTLNLAGNFTNNGTFNRGTGTVVFNGSSQQSISGSAVTDFNNISVTNTAGPPAVQVQSNQNLRGVLTLASNSQFDADGSANTSIFTLISSADDPTSDAAIATIPSGAAVTGSVTVQRYMAIEGSSNGRIYRFISSPVNAPAVSQIQTEIPVTGTFTGSSTCQGCTGSFQSMLQYDESVITDSNGDTFINSNDGFTDFPVNANTETLVNGRGYTIFVRANVAPISTAGSARWDVRAPINSGTISFNAFTTFTSSGTLANDGWNYVGNPYPATIDWDAASGWTRTGINNAIYMKDNGTNLMASYVGGVSVNGGSRYIALGQSFIVKSDGGPINFQANENVKVAGTQTSFIREAAIKDLIRIALKKGSLKDETVIRFADAATEGFDNSLDAYKYVNTVLEGGDNEEDLANLKSSILNFSSLSSGSKWAINTLPKSSCSSTVPLDVSDVQPGIYSLEFSEFDSFDEPLQIRLIDNLLGESIDVTQNSSYSFEVTADPRSFGSRFSISFAKSSVATDLAISGQDICSGSNAAIRLATSQNGVSYFVSIDGKQVSEAVPGNGGNLSIAVNDANLGVGQNNIMIMAAYPGCAPVPLTQKLSITKETIAQVTSVQNGTSCREGQLTLSASGAPSNGKYNWYETQNATTAIEGQDGAEFITPVLNKTKTYYVAVSNALGCEGARTEVKAEIVQYDDAVVTLDDDKLISNYAVGNQWYKDGKEIPGATGKELVPTESGRYTLKVSIGSCSTIAEVDYLVTSLEGPDMPGLNIYPNPVNSIVTVEVQSSNEVTVSLYNSLGLGLGSDVLLRESHKGVKTGQLNLTSQASGFYIIRIKDGKKIYQKKILKK